MLTKKAIKLLQNDLFSTLDSFIIFLISALLTYAFIYEQTFIHKSIDHYLRWPIQIYDSNSLQKHLIYQKKNELNAINNMKYLS